MGHSRDFKRMFPSYVVLLSSGNSYLITCFCLSREKLAVARLQREVAQRTNQGAMVSLGALAVSLQLCLQNHSVPAECVKAKYLLIANSMIVPLVNSCIYFSLASSAMNGERDADRGMQIDGQTLRPDFKDYPNAQSVKDYV